MIKVIIVQNIKSEKQKRKLRRIYKGGCEKSTIKKKESIRKRREK